MVPVSLSIHTSVSALFSLSWLQALGLQYGCLENPALLPGSKMAAMRPTSHTYAGWCWEEQGGSHVVAPQPWQTSSWLTAPIWILTEGQDGPICISTSGSPLSPE